MNTVFIGGSRHISRLSTQVKNRLSNIIENNHHVIVGDANGADKAVQKYLLDAAYTSVRVFCSGQTPRNNLGNWSTRNVIPDKNVKGFQYYAAKDREMAQEADFGLMIWDSKSAGTILNVLRLVRAGKIVVLINIPAKSAINFKNLENWEQFLLHCSSNFRSDLMERATAEEWGNPVTNRKQSLFDGHSAVGADAANVVVPILTEEELATTINAALASGDPASFVDALGNIARARGMSQVAKEAGLARENLRRSLSIGGNPEFATVLKVMAAVGLRFEASKAHPS